MPTQFCEREENKNELANASLFQMTTNGTRIEINSGSMPCNVLHYAKQKWSWHVAWSCYRQLACVHFDLQLHAVGHVNDEAAVVHR